MVRGWTRAGAHRLAPPAFHPSKSRCSSLSDRVLQQELVVPLRSHPRIRCTHPKTIRSNQHST
eukprot:2791045-Rhodomonas_salina.1